MPRNRLKLITALVLAAAILCATPAFARTVNEVITVTFSNINIVLNGRVVATDYEPFIFDGRVYLPVRDVAEALGLAVSWDDRTQTVYLDGTGVLTTPTQTPQPIQTPPPAANYQQATPSPSPIPSPILLFNASHIEILNSNGLVTLGNRVANYIRLFGTTAHTGRDGRGVFVNSIAYEFEAEPTSFRAILNPPVDDEGRFHNSSRPELVYVIFGGSRIIYTSPILTPDTPPQSVQLDISGTNILRIETRLVVDRRIHSINGDEGFSNDSVTSDSFRGIENAVVRFD